MVNLPTNLDFLTFSSFFARLKGCVWPAMAGQKCPHLQSPEFEVRLGRPFMIALRAGMCVARPRANSTARSLRDSLEASRKAGRSNMEQILINLVTGALGGVAVGQSSPAFDLGMIGNIISGLIGGGVLGQVVTLLLPAITAAAQSGNLSVEGIISQVIAGGAGGAILTAIIGAIKNKAAA